MSISSAFLIASLMLLTAEAANKEAGFFDNVGRGIQKGITSVKQPIDKSLSYIGSVDTSFLKSAAGAGKEEVNSSSTGEVNKFFGKLGKDIQKEIVSIKQPIDESIAYIGSVECAHVKKIFGVAYEQIEDEVEPDLDELTLEYKDRAVRIIYKIKTAAQAIPKAHHFSAHDKLILFVHGFATSPESTGFGNVSTALINSGELNVLALDGSSLLRWLYIRATSYVRFMGERLGQVLANMVQNGLKVENIHIIGHSLGAHISGFIGKTFYNLTGKLIPRISGLDPAGPCFSHVDEELRLKKTDAQFVDVIHTDAGVYGLKDAVGHVDFYPNGGSEQPNCLLQQCSHSRAWQFYAESVIFPEGFPAKKCKDWDAFKKGNCEASHRFMGYGCRTDARGLYYLQTGEEPPFNLGEQGLVFHSKDGIIKNITNAIKS